MAEQVLAAFNQHASTDFRASRWPEMIEACIRAFPELDLAEHVAMIERNFANAWWETTTPSVLYGSLEIFERARHNGHKPREPVYRDVYTRV